MKKSLSIFLLAIILLSTFLPLKSYADNEQEQAPAQTESSNQGKFQPQSWLDVEKNGVKDATSWFDTKDNDDASTSIVNGRQEKLSESGNTIKTVIGAIIRVFCYIPQAFQFVISTVTTSYVTDGASSGSDSSFHWFSIYDTVFGKISLFDINFFDTNTGSNANGNVNGIIKEQVAGWFYVVRTVAMIGSLVVLIYVGIRMAISTIASEQAKYKQMLISWFSSFLILFILPYVLILILNLGSSLTALVPAPNNGITFEKTIVDDIKKEIKSDELMPAFMGLLLLIILTIYQVQFFGKYSIRLLKAAFLVIISPLITITYALDKGAAHKKWFQQFIGVVFMQAMHALLYSIFIFSAAELATRSPIIAVAFFMALSRGERIFNYLFNLKAN